MGFVKQSVEAFASPTEIEFELCPEGAGKRMEARERDRANPTVLHPANERIGHARALGQVDLPEPLAAPQGADRTAETQSVHARTMDGRP
jgi:hypothetical protein